MDYLTINGYRIPYPNDFTMERVPNIVAEVKTLSGRTIADINGWKYADQTLQWDTLLDGDLLNLLTATQGNTLTLEFVDLDGESVTVNAIKTSRVSTKTRLKHDNAIVWSNIALSLSFPDCYR